MLWHTAPAWQLCVPSSHSSTSARETRPHVRGWRAPAHTSPPRPRRYKGLPHRGGAAVARTLGMMTLSLSLPGTLETY